MSILINPRQIIKDSITSLRDVWSSSKVSTELSGKQATLVSGTNIKTINNTSLLGSGDITISGGGDIPKINMTATTATLDPNKFYVWGEMASLDISLAPEIDGIENIYKFQFQSGNVATTLSLPAEVYIEKKYFPSKFISGKYIVTIESGIAKVERTESYNTYVTDGLVLQLTADGFDGIKWTDAINGYSFTNNGAAKDGDGIFFDGNASLSADQPLGFSSLSSTFEIVCLAQSTSSSLIWSDTATNAMQFDLFNSTNGIVYTSSPHKTVVASGIYNNIKAISISDSFAYINKYSASYGSDNFCLPLLTGISTRADNRFIGYIYTIRIYNRILLPSEVEANQTVDYLIYNI